MARSTPLATDASSSSPATTSSRVSKTRLQRSRSANVVTRLRSKMAAEASSSAGLEHVKEESQVVAGSSRSKGKARASETQNQLDTAMDMDIAMGLEMIQSEALDDEMALEEQEDVVEVCPILDKNEKPFPIMDLPTEIRIEIYRACLTRPYSILLSKREQPQSAENDNENDQDFDVTTTKTSYRTSANAAQPASVPPPPTPSASRRTLSAGALRDQGEVQSSQRMRLLRTYSRAGPRGIENSRNAGSRVARQDSTRRKVYTPVNEPARNQTQDPLLVNILRVSKEVYKEARSVIYSENIFTLDLNTAMSTLACLHQRSRRHIKHIELEIPTYNEILERFQETVRLHVRYCTGLKTFVIHMPFTLPGADGSGTTGNTTVYANGFDILRWLPQECAIVLKGNICTEITTVVDKHLHLAKSLDKVRHGALQYSSISYEDCMRHAAMKKEAAAAAAAESQEVQV